MRASKQRLSILDVARQASVSPATASRVLSGSRYPVRASTRERVLGAAAELDFQPNLLARALVTARTFTLGAIVHDIADRISGSSCVVSRTRRVCAATRCSCAAPIEMRIESSSMSKACWPDALTG